MESVGEKLFSRCRQECCDHVQDIGITLVRIIKTGCIDKKNALFVEGEFIGGLDLGSARLQACFGTEIGTAAHIDELQTACQVA